MEGFKRKTFREGYREIKITTLQKPDGEEKRYFIPQKMKSPFSRLFLRLLERSEDESYFHTKMTLIVCSRSFMGQGNSVDESYFTLLVVGSSPTWGNSIAQMVEQ